MNPIVFAILAAVSMGMWITLHRLASSYIDQMLGAILISLSAVVFGGILIFSKIKSSHLVINSRGLLLIALAGIAAFFIDYLTLEAYLRGLPLSIGGPIVVGGSLAISVLAGIVMGDAITAVKVFGIVMISAGAVILSVVS